MSILKIKDSNNQWQSVESIKGDKGDTGYPTDAQVQTAVDSYLEDHPTITGTFTNEAKYALLSLLGKVAYTVDNGQDYVDTLEEELFAVKVNSISAVFTQGANVVYDTDPLDSLKQYLVVTAAYSDGTSEVLADSVYALSGTLTVGTSTITVSYANKTDTFTVTVTLSTTAQIVTENKMLVYHSSSPYYTTKSKTNAGITKKYDMASATTILYPAGIIPTDAYTSLVADYDAAILVVYDGNGDPVNYVDEVKTTSFYRWSQNVNGTMTEFSQSWTLPDPYEKIAFTLDMRYLDDAYMYDKTTGDIWFAGRNTPYWGMTNISEAL